MIRIDPEEIDLVCGDATNDLTRVRDCGWDDTIFAREEAQLEFPLLLRRERLDRISGNQHRHTDFYVLYVVRSGRGNRMVNGCSHPMVRGDIFLMPPGNTQATRSSVELIRDGIYFKRELWSEREWQALEALPDLAPFLVPGAEGFAARGFTDFFGHLSPEPHAQIEAVLTTMRREFKQRNLACHLAARGRVYALLVQLAQWRGARMFTAGPARSAGIAEVIRFCDKNFHRPLTVEQLAGMMGVSRAKFFNVFTAELGMPPVAYLRRLRLQHAQQLLADRSLPVADVARLSGFGDATQLARAFRKSHGVAPLEFRRSRTKASV